MADFDHSQNVIAIVTVFDNVELGGKPFRLDSLFHLLSTLDVSDAEDNHVVIYDRDLCAELVKRDVVKECDRGCFYKSAGFETFVSEFRRFTSLMPEPSLRVAISKEEFDKRCVETVQKFFSTGEELSSKRLERQFLPIELFSETL